MRGIVDQVAVRQVDQPLRIQMRRRRRNDDVIDDGVVDEGRTGRSWKAEIGGDERRRTQRRNAETVILGIAVEVDEDVDAPAVQEQGGVAIGQRCRIDEMLGFGRDPPAVLAAVVGAVGDREDLEGGAIMGAKEALKEMGGRMVAEIRRDVRDPQASAPRARERKVQTGPVARDLPLGLGPPRTGDREMGLRRQRKREGVERREAGALARGNLALGHPHELRHLGIAARPLTRDALEVQQPREGLRMVWPPGHDRS